MQDKSLTVPDPARDASPPGISKETAFLFYVGQSLEVLGASVPAQTAQLQHGPAVLLTLVGDSAQRESCGRGHDGLWEDRSRQCCKGFRVSICSSSCSTLLNGKLAWCADMGQCRRSSTSNPHCGQRRASGALARPCSNLVCKRFGCAMWNQAGESGVTHGLEMMQGQSHTHDTKDNCGCGCVIVGVYERKKVKK